MGTRLYENFSHDCSDKSRSKHPFKEQNTVLMNHNWVCMERIQTGPGQRVGPAILASTHQQGVDVTLINTADDPIAHSIWLRIAQSNLLTQSTPEESPIKNNPNTDSKCA